MAIKRKQPPPGPVPNGHDRRAEEPDNDGSGLGKQPAAPDGVSGDWQ
ncbi:MAG: hypothetical protein IJV64_08860 [Oscillospiraceae bacterium]|nr:hypothetical protein [Oscillospiraceae bacterium]